MTFLWTNSTAITPTLTVPRRHRSIPSEETPVRAILTALTAILLLLSGSAHAQSVLRIGLNDDPDALDPTISRAYTGRLVFAALCDKLFDVTPDLKIVPQLATGYEWAADRKSIVIKLRPGVRFQDGEPFNAEAVRFNIERHQNTPGSFRKSEIGEIQSVDVVNDLTVRLNLSQPLVPLLAAFTDRAGMMVSPKAAKALGDKLGTQPVCAGPYKFVQRVAQGKIAVERVADYWDKASFTVDRIEFVPITDSTSRLASLRSGDLHMIERVSPTDLGRDPRRRQAEGRRRARARLPDDPAQRRERRQEQGARRRPGAAGDRARDRPRHPHPDRVRGRVHPGQPVRQPAEPLLQRQGAGGQARRGPGPAAPARGRPAVAGLHADRAPGARPAGGGADLTSPCWRRPASR